MKATIREACLADAEELVSIQISCWKTAYQGLVDSSILDGIDETLWLERRLVFLKREDCVRKVACLNGRIVGFCDGGPSRETRFSDAGEVFSLYVRSGEQGSGLGGVLFRTVCEELKRKGFPRLMVKTLLSNSKSRRFYEKMGAVFSGESFFEMGGKRFLEAVYLIS